MTGTTQACDWVSDDTRVSIRLASDRLCFGVNSARWYSGGTSRRRPADEQPAGGCRPGLEQVNFRLGPDRQRAKWLAIPPLARCFLELSETGSRPALDSLAAGRHCKCQNWQRREISSMYQSCTRRGACKGKSAHGMYQDAHSGTSRGRPRIAVDLEKAEALLNTGRSPKCMAILL